MLVVLGWLNYQGQVSRRARPAAAPISVVAAVAQTGEIGVSLNALGTVTLLATVTAMSQINGQLVHIGFQEGKIVKKGDFLAQMAMAARREQGCVAEASP